MRTVKGQTIRGEGVDGETEPRTESGGGGRHSHRRGSIWREWVRAIEGRLVWGRSVKPGMKGGVDIEVALSQEGWAVRAVEEGRTREKLARAIGEFQKGNSGYIGWDRSATARKPVRRVPQTIFLSSGSNYLSHGGCLNRKFWLAAIVSRYLKNIGAMPQNKGRLSVGNKFLRRYVEF